MDFFEWPDNVKFSNFPYLLIENVHGGAKVQKLDIKDLINKVYP